VAADAKGSGPTPASSPPAGYLVFDSGPSRGLRVALAFAAPSSRVTLGRKDGNDVVIDDPMVSREHAVIERRRDDSLVVRDLGSTNPVQLNERPVTEAALVDGDRLLFGSTTLVFSRSGELPPPVVSVRDSAVTFVQNEPKSPGKSVELALDASSELGQSHTGGGLRSLLRDHKRLADLFLVARKLTEAADSGEVFDTVMDAILGSIDARRAFIATYDADLDELEPRKVVNREPGASTQTIEVSRTLVNRSLRDGVSLLTEDAQADQAFEKAESVITLRLKSSMCVPLLAAGSVVGVVYVDHREKPGRFSREDLEYLTALASLAATNLENLRLRQRLSEEVIQLRRELGKDSEILGRSREMQRVLEQVRKVAPYDTTVLVTGESGTGKELVARAIHTLGKRKDRPFVAVNCAAIPETLLESELFGYSPQSGISGADPKGKPGKFEQAHGGTLFLDEIGDMPLSTQVKILRALQERKVERLGGTESTTVNIRVVAATNKDLEKMAREGRFREDLFFRLRVLEIAVPALRKRGEDVIVIAESHLAKKFGGRVSIAPKAKALLLEHVWPGNVRELLNALEEAVIMGDGKVVRPENLPPSVRRGEAQIASPLMTLEQMERRHVADVLQRLGGNRSKAAHALGISRDTLAKKLKEFGIE